MVNNLLARWRNADPAFKAFLLGVFFLGINAGVLSAAFNNYLNDSFSLTSKQRGFLEFPRELPGFLVLFMTGLLAAVPVRRWAVITGLLTAIGVAGLGFLSPGYNLMLFWMLLWSAGSHLFMTVESVMGLRFAKEGGQGRRLGQISGMTNFAAIAGAGFVWVMAKAAGPAIYKLSFAAAAAASLASAFLFARIPKGGGEAAPGGKRFVFRWRYKWYYLLNILFGARKQIFLTFAPWVLVTQYGASPAVMAALALTAAALGVVFRQTFGALTDRIGERRMFMADAVILLFICAGFAFSSFLPLLYVIFILDNLMFATRIARTTYLNRIVEERSHIAPTVSFGITIDHAVSMTIPAAGGLLWAAYGYKSVFIAASALSVAGFLTALAVEDGRRKAAPPPAPAPVTPD
ncbi:MAG: MFS transporter [Elusimicrobiales bacterium]|nr:MFS transporter [Elusimicrobiales bacterium]